MEKQLAEMFLLQQTNMRRKTSKEQDDAGVNKKRVNIMEDKSSGKLTIVKSA